MSNYEGQPLRDMNPFSNNRPRLTASERIRNKRDAAIYEAEKKQFQESKKKCGNRNVKYYRNGKIKSMKSYKLQKSLARGNILCNDCDNKGTFCEAPASKDDLNTITMGNNAVSEFWGGASLTRNPIIPGDPFQQLPTKNVFINSDISGTWGGTTDVSKSIIGPDAEISTLVGQIPMPYGYTNNFLKIPRNLDGSGVIIDPSNVLFPDELCDPFRYLRLSNLRTYLVVRMPLPIKMFSGDPEINVNQPASCDNSSNQMLVKSFGSIFEEGGFVSQDEIVSGQVDSLCCVGTFNSPIPYGDFGVSVQPGVFGLFDVYLNLFNINNWSKLNMLLQNTASIDPITNLSNWPNEILNWSMTFVKNQIIYSLTFAFVRTVRIIQGTISPVLNQNKYNATRQSYMACLENGTRNINFTRSNTKLSITNAFCTPCLPTGSHSYIVSGQNWTNYPNPTWTIGNKNIYEFINVSGSISIELEEFDCGATLNMDLIAIGGGGGGGTGKRDVTFSSTALPYHLSSAGGGGGGGEVGVRSDFLVSYGDVVTFDVIAGTGGAGADPDAAPDLSGNDGTFSRIYISNSSVSSLLLIDASGGTGGGSGNTIELNSPPGAPGEPAPTVMFFGGAGNGGDAGRGLYTFSATGGEGLVPALAAYLPPNNQQLIDPSIMAFGGGGGGGADGPLTPSAYGGDASANIIDFYTSFDVSGGTGGAGKILDISGTACRYGGGGGGSAVPWWMGPDSVSGSYQSNAYGIGGEGNSAHSYPCDPSGGGNGVPIPAVTIVSDISTTSLASGADGICVGEGGGGGVAYGKSIPPANPTTNTVAGTGGDGADGAVYIIIYDKV